ncbi:hypothetical protein Q9R30_17855 [Arthrobacter sp. AB6]|nr:hypothetical protein [Arthrobacter sp. AB6]MDT0197215.1 hypothetical protein [Arthrobacter sp. AB6]
MADLEQSRDVAEQVNRMGAVDAVIRNAEVLRPRTMSDWSIWQAFPASA